MSAPVRLEAAVDPRERPALVAAAEQLSEALRAAAGVDWPIHLRFWEADGDVASHAGGGVAICSLLPDVDLATDLDAVERRWRERLGAIAAAGAPMLLMTVFRHVADRTTAAGAARLERIRRLNRLALDLSHDTHAAVADIDRAFAHIGARILATDYRLGGRLATEVAAHAIVWSLLSLGLDETIPPPVQTAAQRAHGPLSQINTLVQRRLTAKAAQ